MPYWKLYYHVVWGTADGKPAVSPDIEEEVYDVIRKKVEALGGEVYEIGGTGDHIHAAVTCPPSVSIARLLGEMKGGSAFYINHVSSSAQPVDWYRGYGAVTFRRDNLEEITDYIRRQKEHHTFGSIRLGLEKVENDLDALPTRGITEESADS